MLPDVDAAEIIKACTEFDASLRKKAEWTDWEKKASQKYAVEYTDQLYPPKKIISIATGLPVSAFYGGYPTNTYLEKRGFKIISLNSRAPTDVDIPSFEIGELYRRKDEITGRFGGNGQSGIAPSSKVPAIFLFTGASGLPYGYTDELDEAGVLRYTGEGQLGDMQMTHGNAAIANHGANGRALHVFKATGKGQPCEYLGEFCYGTHFTETGLDKNGTTRQIIIFQLVPISATAAIEATELVNSVQPLGTPDESNIPLAVLRRKAIASAARQQMSSNPKEAARAVYQRSADVKAYVIARAKGSCEACFDPAPFMRKSNGTPYLEPHHINRLSDGGLDHPRYVGAICPNCHRKIHFGIGGHELNSQLRTYIADIETELDNDV